MKVFFDHNVPHKIRRFLTGHDVRTADEMGWAELENGELLNTVEHAGFAVMVTCDKNISYQQNLQGRKLALVVLSTNRWKILRNDPARILAAIDRAGPGDFEAVTFAGRPRRC